uniref:THAP domain-containing protein 1 n=1 Tax=Nothobranchius rachovii TaxID=451742 RepID=A0A1A8QTP0_9TELE
MGKRCSIVGCNSTVGLHLLPLNLEIRRQWLRAIGVVENHELSPDTRVCKRHFTRDSFSNVMEVELGYAGRLRLKSDAIPTIALQRPSQSLPRPSQRPTALLPRHYRDLRPKSEPKSTKESGCQTEFVISKSVPVQADLKPYRRSKATQSRAPGRSVSCDTRSLTEIPSPEILRASSTSLKRQRCAASVSDPSFPLSEIASTVSCASTCIEDCPDNDKNFSVPEEKLLGLFRNCPVCSSHCHVDTMTVGTVLRVTQCCSCCKHRKQWSSQPKVKIIPAGNLQL